MTLTDEERNAIAIICLMAAFADGKKDDDERDRLKDIFDSLGAGFSADLYSQVLFGKVQLEDAAGALGSPEQRRLAYEMAVGICDADGRTDTQEKNFLDQLREALALEEQDTRAVNEDGDALAAMPLDAADPLTVSLFDVDELEPPADSPAKQGLNSDPSLDPMILKYAVLNGGLELLPQSLASMAIIPLQMKMVYRIGASFGYTLDQGHIRELLAAVGLGMTSQVLETYARKLIGKFVKKAMGKGMAKVAKTATGAAMSFASTYALGQVAKSYYAGGRKLEPAALKQRFLEQVEQGKALYAVHKPDVEASARSTDFNSLLAKLKGSAL